MLSEDEVRTFLIAAQHKRSRLKDELENYQPRSLWSIGKQSREELSFQFEMASREILMLAHILEFQGDPFAPLQGAAPRPYGYVPPKELDEVEQALAEKRLMQKEEIAAYLARVIDEDRHADPCRGGELTGYLDLPKPGEIDANGETLSQEAYDSILEQIKSKSWDVRVDSKIKDDEIIFVQNDKITGKIVSIGTAYNQPLPALGRQPADTRALRDGEPCDHPGCLSHISHPCEGCGRIGGKYLTVEQRLDRVDLEYVKAYGTRYGAAPTSEVYKLSEFPGWFFKLVCDVDHDAPMGSPARIQPIWRYAGHEKLKEK